MVKRGGDPRGYEVGIRLINQVVRYRNESVTIIFRGNKYLPGYKLHNACWEAVVWFQVHLSNMT